MEDPDHYDCLLEWLIEDEVVTEFRYDEPADLCVTWCRFANAPPKFTMLRQEIGGVAAYRLADM